MKIPNDIFFPDDHQVGFSLMKYLLFQVNDPINAIM